MTSESTYPNHWWTPIHDSNPPEWEILPQAASREKKEVILSKRNELGILSNFTRTPFTIRGKRYESIEGFWQMMFFPESKSDERAARADIFWPHTREEVSQMNAFEANIAGAVGFNNMQALGITWVTFDGKKMEYWTPEKGEHYRLVVEAMKAKLDQNPEVRKTLLATGDLTLKPDHHQPSDAPPSWKYYQIWMDIRAELQKGSRS